MAKLKYSKFRRNGDGKSLSVVRSVLTSGGISVTFWIAWTDLLLLETDNKEIDFDVLSDEKLLEVERSPKGKEVTFWWNNKVGFIRM